MRRKDWEQYPCGRCGASLQFAPGTSALNCDYCGYENPIAESGQVIEELEYLDTLENLQALEETVADISVHCDSCGAGYTLGSNIHADACHFCGSAIVASPAPHRQLLPQAVLPFQVTQSSANAAFLKWLSRLWLAPGALKKYVRKDYKIGGVYLPYWTFDSDTKSHYQGLRGTYYKVRERVAVRVNGRSEMQTRLVTKVRWTPVSGQVRRQFDDVLIVGSHSLPRRMLNRLRSWRLDALRAYQSEFLSGFKSELYQTSPREGFTEAQAVMQDVIRNDVSSDIGGDLQQITHLDTRHQDIRFKHILLPIWMAAYKYRGKSYRFVVNGQTGEVQGERPYSLWKIVILALVVLGMMILMAGALQYSGI